MLLLYIKNLFSHLRPLFSTLKKLAMVVIVVYCALALFFIWSKNPRDNQQSQREEYLTPAEQTELIAQEFEKDTSQAGQMNTFFYRGLHCTFIGYACGNDMPSESGGFLGTAMKYVSLPYANPPASGISWVESSLAKAGIVPSAYAWEGMGFASLKGYIDIWLAFRNIAFLLLTLVMIGIGFMIMFRMNSGQTEIKIESALPRIVIAMIMITFSYAIAGFFVDVMYAVIALSIGIFQNAGINNLTGGGPVESDGSFIHFAESSFMDILPFGGTILGSSFTVGNDLWNMIPTMITRILAPVLTLIAIGSASSLGAPTEGFISSFFNINVFGNGVGFLPRLLSSGIMTTLLLFISNYLPGLILGTIIALTLLIFMFRLMFMFIEAYVKVLLYTLFSPVILLFSAIPGNGSIGWWMKNLLGELSVFPTFIILTMTSAAIIEVNNRGAYGTLGYVVWQLTEGESVAFNLPFVSQGFRPESFNNVVALGLLLMAPDFMKMVKGMLGVDGKGINFSPAMFFGSIGALSGAMGAANSLGTSIMGQVDWDKKRKDLYTSFGRGVRSVTNPLNEGVGALRDKFYYADPAKSEKLRYNNAFFRPDKGINPAAERLGKGAKSAIQEGVSKIPRPGWMKKATDAVSTEWKAQENDETMARAQEARQSRINARRGITTSQSTAENIQTPPPTDTGIALPNQQVGTRRPQDPDADDDQNTT